MLQYTPIYYDLNVSIKGTYVPEAHKRIYMLKVQEYPRTGTHKGAGPIYFY